MIKYNWKIIMIIIEEWNSITKYSTILLTTLNIILLSNMDNKTSDN